MTRSLPELGLAVKRLQVQHHRAANDALAEIGVSLVQWDALRHLAEHPGISLHDLAMLTFQTDQACGALAGRMEANGLIERMPGPGRAVRHRLTEKGERLQAEGAAITERVIAKSYAPLSPEQLQQFDEILGLLVRPPALPTPGP